MIGNIGLQKIVLVGGSGFIGSYVKSKLTDEGIEVVVLSRNHSSSSADSELAAAVRDPWFDAIDGSDAVINLAGETIAQRWTVTAKKRILESRVQTTKRVGSAIQNAKHPPKIWINISASGFFGNRDDEILTEDSPRGTGFLAEVCEAWEACALESCPPEVSLAIVRLGVVLGSSGGAFPRFWSLTSWGLFGKVGNGKQYVPWVHIEDVARVLNLILDRQLSGVILASSPNPVTSFQFSGAMKDFARRPLQLGIPTLALRIGAFLKFPTSLLSDSQRMVPNRLENEGFSFQYPSLESVLVELGPLVKVR